MKNLFTYKELLEFQAAMGDSKSLPKLGIRRGRSETRYIAGSADDLAGNTGSMILQGTKKQTGVTNFEQGNIIPKGQIIIVTGIRLLFETVAAKTTLTADWAANAPANWKNGELVITQDGQGVLMQSSITDLTNFKASTGNDADFRDLPVPFQFRPDVTFDIQANLAAGATVNQLFKLELRCVTLFLESNG